MVGLSVQHQRELRRPNQPFYRENMQGIAGVLVVEFLYFLKHQLGTEASANVSAGQHKLSLEVRYGKNFAGDYGIFLEKLSTFCCRLLRSWLKIRGSCSNSWGRIVFLFIKSERRHLPDMRRWLPRRIKEQF